MVAARSRQERTLALDLRFFFIRRAGVGSYFQIDLFYGFAFWFRSVSLRG